MSDIPSPAGRRAQRTYWLLITGQWLLLTFALAGVMTRSAMALRDYVSPSVTDGWLAAGALTMGLLLGLTVYAPKVLVPLVLAGTFVAAVIFGLVIYLPAWQGTLFRSTTLANYAQQQALFLFLWTTVPALVGALIGYLLAGGIRHALELRHDGPDLDHIPWWERTRRDTGHGTRD